MKVVQEVLTDLKIAEKIFFREAEDNVINALNLTVEAPIKRIEVVSITEYKGAGLLGKGSTSSSSRYSSLSASQSTSEKASLEKILFFTTT